MLEQVLNQLHNWFVVGIYNGQYSIESCNITLPFLQDGQYFRIIGSLFNDGLHRYGPDMEALQDETFDGTIWAMAVPKSVIDDVELLSELDTKIQDITVSFANSGFTSESKADYSYQKDIGLQLSALNDKRSEIMKRLKAYQKLCGMW